LLDMPAVHNRSISVCMVTGDMSVQRQEQARRHGFELLHKPVGASDLQRFLQRAG
jgi:two-component system, sensor histidine kinase